MSFRTVVFVCAGNTCRSPLAMALARRRWPDGPAFASAGMQAVAGQPAMPEAVAMADQREAGLADHRSQPVTRALLDEADWLIAMTRAQVAWLNAHREPTARARIGLLGCPNEDLTGRPTPAAEEVADPIGAGLDAYRRTADQLERLLGAWEPTFTAPTGGER